MPNRPMPDALVSTLRDLSLKSFADDENLATALRSVADAGCALLPNCAAASVTLVDRRTPRTVASTDDRATAVDIVQYEVGDGACLRAALTESVVRVDDVATEDRWPELARAAAEHELASLLSVPIQLPGPDTFGALNLYAEVPKAYGPDDEQLSQEFAAQASVLVENVRAYWAAIDEARQLALAMQSRAEIEQAKGVIMASHGCGPDEAFDVLRRISQTENRKLRDVARDVVRAARQRTGG